MRKFLLAAVAAFSTLGFIVPAQASNGVFVTFGNGYRGDHYSSYGPRYRGGYYYDDGYYRPRYRSFRGYKGGFRYRYRNYDRFDHFDRRDFRRFKRDFRYRY
jgi:hypothetical protein